VDRCKQHLETLDKDTLVTYWHIGDELVKDGYNPKEEQWNGKKTKGRISILGKKINHSQQTISQAYRLRITYSDLTSVTSKVKSWYEWTHPHKPSKQQFDYQLYNVWKTFKLNLNFGERYLGETPPELIANLLYYYTNEGDWVLDPMAGGGVTIDICKLMKRNCLAFDINPIRDDIESHDILRKFSLKQQMDFVFLDPPYFNLIEEYPLNNFTKDYNAFKQAMKISLLRIQAILKSTGKVAILLKPMNRKMLNGDWLDLTIDVVCIARKLKYKLVKRICAPLSTEQFKKFNVSQAKKQKVMLNILRDIIILEKT